MKSMKKIVMAIMLALSITGPTGAAFAQSPASMKPSKQELLNALANLKKDLAVAQSDLEFYKTLENGRVAVKVRNYSSIALAASIVHLVYVSYANPLYFDGEVGLAFLITTVASGVTAVSSAVYVEMTNEEYSQAKSKVNLLVKRLDQVEAKLKALEIVDGK